MKRLALLLCASCITPEGPGIEAYVVAQAAEWRDPYTEQPHTSADLWDHIDDELNRLGVELRSQDELPAPLRSGAATTRCHRIYLSDAFNERTKLDQLFLIYHELAHVRQCQYYGQTRFLSLYLADPSTRWAFETAAHIEGMRAWKSIGFHAPALSKRAEFEATHIYDSYSLWPLDADLICDLTRDILERSVGL